MHTVIIANEKMTQLFRDYKNLFAPFLNDEEISFCHWNEDGPDLDTALPGLTKYVNGENQWRALVVHDPGYYLDHDGREIYDEANPYDYAVNYKEKRIEESEIPLIRLTHLLAGFPDLGIKDIVEKPVEQRINEDQIEYDTEEYSEEQKHEHALLQEKYDQLLWKPKDLWLVSIRRKRTKLNKKDLKEIWTNNLETDSSRFWERNNYPDVCRFMCYDVADNHKEFFCKEIFGFWMTVLTMAMNKIPPSNIQAYRLYKVSCNLDRREMQKALTYQYSKLCHAKETIENALKVIPESSFEPDEELLRVQPVPVVFENISDKDIYINPKTIGFTKDFPQDEMGMWQEEFKDAKKNLVQYVKEPRRAIDRAAERARFMENEFFEDEYELDEIQMEEITETIYQLEEDILSSQTTKLVDLDAYADELRDVNEEVEGAIKGRMNKKTLLVAGMIALIVFFVGFVPYLIHGLIDGITVFMQSLPVVIICLVCFVAVGIAALLHSRNNIQQKIGGFNKLVAKIATGVNYAASTFEEYLTLICTYMKAQSIVQGVKDKEKSIKTYKGMLRMHKCAVEETLEQIYIWCAAFDLSVKCIPIHTSDEFYDFELAPRYCPIYTMGRNNEEQTITINNSGELLYAPYEFVTKLNVERLEVYEKGGDYNV